MQLITSKKSALYRRHDEDDDDSSPSGGNKEKRSMGWATTDPRKFRQLAKEAQQEGKRAPELWIPQDSSKLVRFVDNDPVVAFRAYRLKVAGKWTKVICPGDDEPDLLASVVEQRPALHFVWRVIDIKGYEDKKGKMVTNIPRFYVTGSRVYEQIMVVKEDIAASDENGSATLKSMNVSIKRTGSGTETQYHFFPRPGELTLDMKKAIAVFPKVEDYYAPASQSQQERIMAKLGRSSDED